MVSWIKIVKSLAVSLETINLPERFAFLIREIEEKVSLQGLSWYHGWKKITKETRKIIILKLPIDETVAQSLGKVSLE